MILGQRGTTPTRIERDHLNENREGPPQREQRGATPTRTERDHPKRPDRKGRKETDSTDAGRGAD